MNIRPDCDFIRELREGVDVELYLLEGENLDDSNPNIKSGSISFNKGSTVFRNGTFQENIAHSYVSFIDDGKIINFLFKEIKIKKWNDIKDKRIGRLLQPFITYLRQKYSFYLLRQGLPAIPEKAIFPKSLVDNSLT